MPIERLSSEDQLMLDASAAWPQDIGALAVLDGSGLFDGDGRFRIEAVAGAISGRLHLVPRFRQRIHVPRRGLGAPYWADDPTFDLAQHVRELPLEAPVGEAELLLAAEQLRRQRFDPSRPMWAMWLLTGLPDQRVGMFVKIHHTIADGIAAMTILAALLEREPAAEPAAPRPWTPAPLPSAGRLFGDNLLRRLRGVVGAFSFIVRPRSTLRSLREAWPATRELLAEEPGAKTSIDRVIGPDRRLAVVRGSYPAVRRIGHAFDASVNDVLLAITAAGLRALLISRGERVEGVTLRVYVPVSLRRHLRGPQQGTNIAQMAVPLPLGRADPVDRLRALSAETTQRKARPRPRLGKLFRGRLATRLLLKAVIRQRVNVTTASIPGPKRPLYLAGARMLEVFPVLALIGNEPLGVGALSYAETWGVGITADGDSFPDLDVFAAGAREELEALVRTADAHPLAERATAEVAG